MGNPKGYESDHCICLLLTHWRNPVVETWLIWSDWWRGKLDAQIDGDDICRCNNFLYHGCFFHYCVQGLTMIDLYSCCNRPCPQYEVLPPCAAGPLPHYNLIKEEDGRGGGVHEKITRNFGDDLAPVHPRIASCPLLLWQPWKTLVLCNLSGSRLNQTCWSLEDFVKVQPEKCGWVDSTSTYIWDSGAW